LNLFSRKYRGSSYVGFSTFFKAFLVFGMIAVISIFIYFSQTIVSGLRADAARVSNASARLIQYGASEATDPAVIDFIFENIITKVNFPIIVTDNNGTPVAWTVDIDPADTTSESRKQLRKLVREYDRQNQPIEITSENKIINVLHYGDSNLIVLLQLIPAIEIFVVGFFILIAFIGFRHIQISEQRSIWVGMAKETAHQLGTPLSSLIGSVELLRLKYEEGKMKFPAGDTASDFDDVSNRMLGDLKRLDRIATRFGQIGSIPDLEEGNLNDVISDVVAYFKARIPSRGVTISEKYGDLPPVKINTELIGWVIENLIKNSMESTSPKAGIIGIKTSYDPGHKKVLITVEDNGRGVPPAQQKRIFAPGFTTKKRGWGLGLTLARRIVEEYHRGKISLKYSDPGIRTAFGIELPV
jgi:signal transduction histidine kinase